MGAANESERMIFTGDQIAIFSVDKNTKKLISIAVVFTKGRCSGICLSDNAKFFYTSTQKRKYLAKFKVVEKETNSKLAPLSKTETGQLLDCTSIKKARIKPGHTHKLKSFLRENFRLLYDRGCPKIIWTGLNIKIGIVQKVCE